MSSFKFPSGYTIENLTPEQATELREAQQEAQQVAESRELLQGAAIGQTIQPATIAAPVNETNIEKVDFAADLMTRQFGFDAGGNKIDKKR
jgi:hypothetical protein